jgi:hypothetical protein
LNKRKVVREAGGKVKIIDKTGAPISVMPGTINHDFIYFSLMLAHFTRTLQPTRD